MHETDIGITRKIGIIDLLNWKDELACEYGTVGIGIVRKQIHRELCNRLRDEMLYRDLWDMRSEG